jgi:hypothetical protein
MRSVVAAVLEQLQIADITNYLSKSDLSASISIGEIVAVQGAHTFKKSSTKIQGKGQMRSGVRKANNIELSFCLMPGKPPLQPH